jgi:hypothetical protein
MPTKQTNREPNEVLQAKAAVMMASGMVHNAVVKELGIGKSTLDDWKRTPTFQQLVGKEKKRLIDDLRERCFGLRIADQYERILSANEDLEATDAFISARECKNGNGLRARETKFVKVYLVKQDEATGEIETLPTKQVREVEVETFDSSLVSERRALRESVAKELGQVAATKTNVSFSDLPDDELVRRGQELIARIAAAEVVADPV